MRRGFGRWRASRRRASLLALAPMARSADTLEWALIQAYQNNPQLNAQRAALRATDENVPQALSGYRPRVSVIGQRRRAVPRRRLTKTARPAGRAASTPATSGNIRRAAATACTVNADAVQRLPDRQPHAAGGKPGVCRARDAALTEQTVLLDAATAYMNLLRDTAILDLQRRNVEVLQEQLRQTRDRFNVGEVTRTDVAQAESRLAAGRSQLLTRRSRTTRRRGRPIAR